LAGILFNIPLIKYSGMKRKNSKNKENQGNINTNVENQDMKIENSAEVENVMPSEEATFEEKLAEVNDKYLRLSAEFDNYRKRTAREKLEILRNGGEEIIKGLLPVLDDFDRCIDSMETATDIEPVKEGILLIQSKLSGFLKSQGLSEIETEDQDFDTNIHDAVTKFPVSDESKKGKIIDIAQKGYKLNDKVIRFAKVIVGE
jgi:molecular chaperone GrpE